MDGRSPSFIKFSAVISETPRADPRKASRLIAPGMVLDPYRFNPFAALSKSFVTLPALLAAFIPAAPGSKLTKPAAIALPKLNGSLFIFWLATLPAKPPEKAIGM